MKKWMEEALEKGPEVDEALLSGLPRRVSYARWLHQNGKAKEAERQLREFLIGVPESAAGWQELGSVYRKGGRLEQALKCYRRAIELDPFRTAPWELMEPTLRSMGKMKEAEEAKLRGEDARRLRGDPSLN